MQCMIVCFELCERSKNSQSTIQVQLVTCAVCCYFSSFRKLPHCTLQYMYVVLALRVPPRVPRAVVCMVSISGIKPFHFSSPSALCFLVQSRRPLSRSLPQVCVACSHIALASKARSRIRALPKRASDSRYIAALIQFPPVSPQAQHSNCVASELL